MSLNIFDKKLMKMMMGTYDNNTLTCLEISKENLLKAKEKQDCPDDYLKEICCVKFNDYDALRQFFPNDYVDLYKKRTEDTLKKLVDEYDDDDEWDSEYFITRIILYCEKKIVCEDEYLYKNYIEAESGAASTKQL